MRLRPFGDRVVVKPVEEEVKSAIIIPDSASKEVPISGEIIACGPDVDNRIRVGSRVMYGKYSGSEIKFQGHELVILQQSDLLVEVVDET